ncbi:MAG: epoxyqueuosine reductase QueH [Candidatus Saganbacteria bacterium]|nr:epoxyqueuosine reductase QueH [Candidatus Saganbacteria bacterium]
MKRILLHTCCAPCTTSVHEWMLQNGFDVTGFFFNPNIHPREEFEKRRDTLSQYSLLKNFPVIYSDVYMEKEYSAKGEKDCSFCYEIRLEATAKLAKEEKYDCFSTTLLISPYQDHEKLKEIGQRMAEKYGIPFFYRNFRPEFRRSQALAKELGLYRQKYCGCTYSIP